MDWPVQRGFSVGFSVVEFFFFVRKALNKPFTDVPNTGHHGKDFAGTEL